jgi:hypothetical protein
MVAHVHYGGEDKVPRIARVRSARSSSPIGGTGVGRPARWSIPMTRNRRRKAEIRARQAMSGTPYSFAAGRSLRQSRNQPHPSR